MLKELSQYENLGTPKLFCELFNQLRNASSPWTVDNVRSYLYNRVIDGDTVFDGCLPFAEAIKAVIIDENGLISLDVTLESALATSENYLSNKLLEMILLSVQKDQIFHDIFCSQNISYDIIYRSVQVDGSAFRFRYSNFRRLLIDFKFLYPHPDKNIRKFIVNPRHKKLFDRQIMPEIKRRKLGIGELEKTLEQKLIYGAEAEAFALKYEKGRLMTHPKLGKVEIISEYDVAAGYDIVSYNDSSSVELNRFIEVKSFTGAPNFHWSRNEMDTARIKKDQYFLYLVDRERVNDVKYFPTIIQNPYDEILANNAIWIKRIDSYFIIKK